MIVYLATFFNSLELLINEDCIGLYFIFIKMLFSLAISKWAYGVEKEISISDLPLFAVLIKHIPPMVPIAMIFDFTDMVPLLLIYSLLV